MMWIYVALLCAAVWCVLASLMAVGKAADEREAERRRKEGR